MARHNVSTDRIYHLTDLIAKIKYWLGKVWEGLICMLTPRCHEMTRLISSEREKPHSLFVKTRMRFHYGICIWCKRYHDHLGFLGKLSRAFPEHSCEHGVRELSDEAKARFKKRLADASD